MAMTIACHAYRMAARNRRARRLRLAAEFEASRLDKQLASPVGTSAITLTSWTLPEIFAARDAQMRGRFLLPAKAAEFMRTDCAIATARENRLAPQRCIGVDMIVAENIPAASAAKAESIRNESEGSFGQKGVSISADTLASIHSCLIDHDLAIGFNVTTPREDGSRVDFEHKAWPIELVRWDTLDKCFKTRVDPESVAAGDLDPKMFGGSYEIPITHGDGRWVIYQRYEIDPFKHATLLAALVIWARHAFALFDWAKGSQAHGAAKMLGTMPSGVPMQASDPAEAAAGGLSPEANAMIELMRGMLESDAPAGLLPFGATAAFVSNNSTAWNVFDALVKNAETAAARLYLGTDGVLGSNGGAPGVDIQSLFGVAATKVEGDLKCIQRGIDTGVIQPWCAMNFGDSALAPSRRYKLADADADAARASDAVRTKAFYDEIDRARASGFIVDQEFADKTAAKHGIKAPLLSVSPPVATAPSISVKS
jgi:hypothetical protein